MKKTSLKTFATIILLQLFKLSNAQFSTTTGNITQLTPGNVGVGTATPLSLLEVKNGSVLFDGTTGSTPASGSGIRLMWVTSKGAFRVGQATLTSWDDINIGYYSTAFGSGTKASGSISTAFGLNTQAIGNWSTAFGNGTVSSGNYSTALGYNTTSSGNISFSIGAGAIASGATSFAAGSANIASGTSTAVFGTNNTAQSYISFVIGSGCYNPGTYSSTSWIGTDPLFVIGNNGVNNNALTVLKNGNVLINKVTQLNSAYILDVNGKIRANEIVVNTTGADFVFENNYNLMDIKTLEQNIKQDKHLPGIVSASEMQENGVGLAELDKSLLQKIEELTLYIIEQNKRIEALEISAKTNK